MSFLSAIHTFSVSRFVHILYVWSSLYHRSAGLNGHAFSAQTRRCATIIFCVCALSCDHAAQAGCDIVCIFCAQPLRNKNASLDTNRECECLRSSLCVGACERVGAARVCAYARVCVCEPERVSMPFLMPITLYLFLLCFYLKNSLVCFCH